MMILNRYHAHPNESCIVNRHRLRVGVLKCVVIFVPTTTSITTYYQPGEVWAGIITQERIVVDYMYKRSQDQDC